MFTSHIKGAICKIDRAVYTIKLHLFLSYQSEQLAARLTELTSLQQLQLAGIISYEFNSLFLTYCSFKIDTYIVTMVLSQTSHSMLLKM